MYTAPLKMDQANVELGIQQIRLDLKGLAVDFKGLIMILQVESRVSNIPEGEWILGFAFRDSLEKFQSFGIFPLLKSFYPL